MRTVSITSYTYFKEILFIEFNWRNIEIDILIYFETASVCG